MREDRVWKRPNSQPPKRQSEACVPIERYACAENTKLTFISEEHYILVQGYHCMAHNKPTYRQIEFPINAREWIQSNISFNIRCTEVYRQLCKSKLIDSKIHTVEQVYYWIYKYSKSAYMVNQDNPLLSAKLYLEQSKFIKQEFKVIIYLENDFLWVLGFLTPLFKYIGAENITEIIIDSTFKTNQERFELFVINLNCGGYGVPIAYMYLATLDGTEQARNNPINLVKTQVEALRMFFTSLHQEGLQPVFVLIDKDAGEIFFVSEAWSWNVSIQICHWHIIHAIDRKIKEKKSKASTYSKTKALEAYQKFEFIDPLWFQDDTGPLCPDNYVKHVLDMVKRHSSMHPLIPVRKDSFLNSNQLTQIITEQLIPDFEIKLIQYDENRIFPAWWHEFKAEWRKAATADIQPNIEERYHIDIDNWNNFLPTFLKTSRRHDYPLLTFGNNKIPVINPTNNSWTRFSTLDAVNDSIEINFKSNDLQNILIVNHNIMEERKEKYVRYKKKFDIALELYQREMNNDNFVNNFDVLITPLLREIEECETVLKAHKQQATWKSKRKLAAWLR
ncbi:15169_t:CDS:2 [Cetraspora pellucida]|uniref:15169_t:CDS:1 n=1 Tax=Cetraspora pellucida TaxID=1433469 RepID=A0ACA9MP67_9GLOM|nr:15169_t:CDS:2 [Cetraspora pellucida]